MIYLACSRTKWSLSYKMKLVRSFVILNLYGFHSSSKIVEFKIHYWDTVISIESPWFGGMIDLYLSKNRVNRKPNR